MVVWDPRLSGANCDACPLREARVGEPVPSAWPANPIAIVLGEAPGKDEVRKGVPFVGKSGIELEKSLRALGANRSHVALVNTISCLAPEGDNGLDKLLHSIQKANKARAERGKPPIPTPMECCRPRLLAELRRLPRVIAVGKRATETALGTTVKIMSVRGGPRNAFLDNGDGTAEKIQVLPTVHPAFVLRQRRWTGAFRADLGRAFRWFTTGLSWKEPTGLYRPTPAQLRAFLESIASQPFSVLDVETAPGFPEQDHFDPMFDRLRCIGIGTLDGRGCVIPFRSVTGQGGFYTGADRAEILELVREYLTSGRWKKAGWNSRYYDAMVIRHSLGVEVKPHLDGIGLHKLAEPELPHGLEYAGSVHTDVDKWKQGHIATTAQTDAELWKYNLTDCIVTAQTIPALKRACDARSQTHLLRVFARLQDVAAMLHENGMAVDQAKRREWDRKLLWQAEKKRREIRDLAGMPKLNPGSYPQVGDLLFEKLGIAPYSYTDLGDPSTEDDALRAFLSETWSLPDRTKKLIQALRDYRKTVKRRGVIVRLRPITEEFYAEPLLVDFEETPEEREERERRLAKGKSGRAPGLCLPDGRVHADWNAGGTVGWRYSSSSPNMQNWELKLRDIFVAAPGNVLVACDEAQLELRMVVGMAQCRYYLDAFASGADPHKQLCVDTFGKAFEDADASQQTKLRRCVKELTYGGLYGASNETKQEIVTSAEDENERLIFPDFTLREVSAFTDNWHRRNPEIAVWWEKVVEDWRRDHFLAEPILGLKCDFLDGEDKNKLLNYQAQAGGAALAHLALFRALDERPHLARQLVQQGHDSIVFEPPEAEGEELGKFLEECMHVAAADAYGLGVEFIGESKVGKSWKEV